MVRSTTLCAVLASFLSIAGLAFAQTTQGGITGTIRDEKGAEASSSRASKFRVATVLASPSSLRG